MCPPNDSHARLDIVDPDEPTLTTGDMARLSDSTLRTVRFYEQEGLIKPRERAGGRRMFTHDELQKLQLALDLREAGLSLQDIKELFELKSRYATPQQASHEITDMLSRQILSMQEKIAKLRKLREELATMVTVISECSDCDGANFPAGCGDCDVLEQPGLPRAMRVLWSR
ncbi:MAG: MerR family transcriptional regulator [Myxococcales bacterium]|nr:MerR family transcriptional regulator [Myxococcales bacterium]